MTATDSGESWVANTIEDGVRGSVVRSIREKFPNAGEVVFSELKDQDGTWTVRGTDIPRKKQDSGR